MGGCCVGMRTWASVVAAILTVACGAEVRYGAARSPVATPGPYIPPEIANQIDVHAQLGACLSGEIDDVGAKSGWTPGVQCEHVASHLVSAGLRSEARYFMRRACEFYGEGGACAGMASSINPGEGYAGNIPPHELASIRSLLAQKCDAGVRDYEGADVTRWLCMSLALSCDGAEPKDPAMALRAYARACATGHTNACDVARSRGASVAVDAQAAFDRANQQEDQARAAARAEVAADRAQRAQDRTAEERRDANAARALSDSIAAGANAGFGTNLPLSGNSDSAGSGGPGARTAAPRSTAATPPPASGVGCSPGYHSCASSCCPDNNGCPPGCHGCPQGVAAACCSNSTGRPGGPEGC